MAENAAEVKSMSERYKALANRVKGLKAGTQCPTCLMRITEQNLPEVRNGMMSELKTLAEQGRARVSQGKELSEMDNKSKTVFEQFKSGDLKKLYEDMKELKPVNVGNTLRIALEQIEQLQKYGNLDEDEYSELNCLTAELAGIDAQIQAVQDMCAEKRLEDVRAQQKVYEEQLLKYRNVISALSEFLGTSVLNQKRSVFRTAT